MLRGDRPYAGLRLVVAVVAFPPAPRALRPSRRQQDRQSAIARRRGQARGGLVCSEREARWMAAVARAVAARALTCQKQPLNVRLPFTVTPPEHDSDACPLAARLPCPW